MNENKDETILSWGSEKEEKKLPKSETKLASSPKKQSFDEKLSQKEIAGLGVGAIIIAIVFAVLYIYFVSPNIISNSNLVESGKVTAVNTKIFDYDVVAVEGSNIKQKALGIDEATTPPAFIFTNGKESEIRKVVDLYFDFGDQQSRDLFLLNHSSLQALIESGRIELRLHAIPTNHPFSVYAAEALAEVFYFSPEKAWDFLIAINKFGMENQTKELSIDEYLKGVSDTAQTLKVNDIDEESLTNGTFSSWLLSIDSDPQLAQGTKIPNIFIDGMMIEFNTVDLTGTGEFYLKLQEGK